MMKAPSQEKRKLPKLLSEKEAAELLGLSPVTLQGWRAKRKGPPWVRIEGTIRYKLEDLEEFLEKNRVIPKSS